MKYILGIDLGTTNITCNIGQISSEGFSSYQHRIKQISTEEGAYKILPIPFLPSYVLLNENNIYTGDSISGLARELIKKQGCTLIKSIKNHIGDDFWKCKLDKEDGKKIFNVIEISSFLLRTVWNSVKEEINEEDIIRIIITIPAKFSSKMRKNTLLSAHLANFPKAKLKLLDEPVAALFSDWNLKLEEFNHIKNQQLIMVYDIGGGTVDVSIIKISESKKIAEIIATSRYNNLGGVDWDLEIATCVLNNLIKEEQYNDYFEVEDKKVLRSRMIQLIEFSKKIKENLDNFLIENKLMHERRNLSLELNEFLQENSNNINYNLDLSAFAGLQPQAIKIGVNQLLGSFAHLLRTSNFDEDTDSFFNPIYQALESTKQDLTISNIDYIFITGGGSKSRLIKNQLSRKFFGQIINLDAKYSISEGAVKYALLVEAIDENKKWLIEEKTNEKIFLGISGRKFLEIFDSGQKIPSAFTEINLEKEGIKLYQIAEKDEETNSYKLSLYQGLNPNDPLIRPFIEVNFDEFTKLDIYNDIYLHSLTGDISENQIYTFTFNFIDSKKKEVELKTIEFDIDKILKNRKLSTLNNLTINDITSFSKLVQTLK